MGGPIGFGAFLNHSAYLGELKSAVNGDEHLLREALALYPPKPTSENNAQLVGWFQSDETLCKVRREVMAAATTGRATQAYMYRFDWFFQSNKSCTADSNYHDPASGSNHCDEMTFVFG